MSVLIKKVHLSLVQVLWFASKCFWRNVLLDKGSRLCLALAVLIKKYNIMKGACKPCLSVFAHACLFLQQTVYYLCHPGFSAIKIQYAPGIHNPLGLLTTNRDQIVTENGWRVYLKSYGMMENMITGVSQKSTWGLKATWIVWGERMTPIFYPLMRCRLFFLLTEGTTMTVDVHHLTANRTLLCTWPIGV